MKRISIVIALLLAIVGSFFFLPREAMAETKTWIGGEGVWSDPGNWSPTGVPTSTDDITIDGDNGTESVVWLDVDFNLELEGSIRVEMGDTFIIDPGHVLHATGEILNGGLIHNDGTINSAEYFGNGGVIENEGTINNDAMIFNNGAFLNNGAIYNRETSGWDNEPSVHTYIENHGTIDNDFSSMRLDGPIYNYGTIDNNFSHIENYCEIINYGTINHHGNETFSIDNHSIIDNYGTINNDGTIKNGGVFLNNCGAIFTGNPVEGTPVEDICNDPPIANDDYYSSPGDTPLNVPAPGVLGNDSDPDGDDLVVIDIPAQPDNGSVTVEPDGAFSYTPDPGFRGDDSFDYEISDGEGGTDTATVTITVSTTGLEQILSRLDEIESKVNKLDIEVFQMPSKGWCVYHIGANIGGLPVDVELEQAFAVRNIEGQPMAFEEVTGYSNEYTFGVGHLRVWMDMPDDFDALLFQFVFKNPDTGLHGTVIAPHEYGDYWERAKQK